MVDRIVTRRPRSTPLQRNELVNQARVVGEPDAASGEQADRVEVDFGSIELALPTLGVIELQTSIGDAAAAEC